MNVGSLMVEGGAGILSSFLAERLADQVVVTISPRFVGGLPAVAARRGGPAAVVAADPQCAIPAPGGRPDRLGRPEEPALRARRPEAANETLPPRPWTV